MTTDPFEQLRIDDELVAPDPTFVTRLRRRVVAGLDAAAALHAASTLPKVRLSERSTAMTDTTTRAAGAATAVATPRRSLTPYVCVTPAIEALAWYVDVLDAVETVRYTGDDGRVGHAEVTISGATLMLSDEYPELDVVAPTTLGGTPTTLHLEVPDVDATYERAVAAGARPAGAPKDETYGARSFSMLDPFGHRWMVQTPIATPTNEEIQATSPGFTVTAPDAPVSAAAAAAVELGYLTLGLPDVAVASRFYGQLFGWATEPGSLGDGYAHVHNTRLPVGFVTAPAAEAPVLYFKVSDLAAPSLACGRSAAR
ncbi:MAG: VOC family protein [Acidimicrobiia bacterium]|nr:VOC family protein [Acidimicrobiia bacterium]